MKRSFDYTKPKAKQHLFVQNYTKGKTDRTVPYSDELGALFKKYFDLKNQASKDREIHFSFFNQQIKKICTFVGFEKKLHSHMARHIFATIYGKQCKDLGEAMALQKMMGHKSFSTTEQTSQETK